MTVQRQEHIWSAVLRALLGLRRDQHLASQLDAEVITLINQPHAAASDLYQQLRQLVTATPLSVVGQKLTSYLDFNRMGNLTVAIVSSATIADSLRLLHEHPANFFRATASVTITRTERLTTIRWQPSPEPFEDGFYAYVLLALFRYQAGQRFCFACGHLPKTIIPLLVPVFPSVNATTNVCELSLENKWLSIPSFHFNPTLLNAVQKSLLPGAGDSVRDRILACIESSDYPARIRLPAIAEQLRMSETEVRKKLKAEGVAFSQLLKRAIHDLATQHLLAGNKAQEVSDLLGFSDRRAFDRSFKEFTGISPGQLRQLGSRLRFQRGNQQLSDIVTALPPLPKTVQSILALDDNAMRINDVVPLIEQDPIFRAHIMAKASRAAFGRAPSSLNEALSRNLGLANIKNLAVLFAAQQQLSEQSVFHDIEQLIDCLLLSERLSQHIVKQPDEPVLLFGLLSLLLLFHEDCVFSRRVLDLWHQSTDFAEFRHQLKQEVGVCLYGASSLMLLKWGMQGAINRQLWSMCGTDQAPLSNELTAIRICHDIALTQIMPLRNKDVCLTLHQEELSDDQRDALVMTLASWAAH